MSNPKLDRWLHTQSLPQRLLLSGGGDLLPMALKVASKLLQQDSAPIAAGLEADVKLCLDDKKSLKIGDRQTPDPLTVRGLIKWLNQTPLASHRVLILENLERTSRDAMQAWLKILEEPPSRVQFILTTKNHHQLPITILSRVTVLPIGTTNLPLLANPEAELFLGTKDLITKFRLIDDLDKSQKENPQAVSDFMLDLLALARRTQALQSLLPQLFQAHQDINRNVNRRLVLEHLALGLQNR